MDSQDRRYKIGRRQEAQTRGSIKSMENTIKTILGAAIVAAIGWAGSTLLRTSVTTAEIQKDLTNLDKSTQRELTVINQRIIDLRMEFRDYKNEQRTNPSQGSYGRGLPPAGDPSSVDLELRRGD